MPMGRILIEAAIDSVRDAERAVREGADRLEVCATLDVGGLTPRASLIKECLELGVPCVAMARPRAGNFAYTPDEVRQLHAAVARVCEAGAHGVVFGVLSPHGSIDEDAVNEVIELCGAQELVFHRAFDVARDASEALDTLMACGVTRVLTSGHAATAIEGIGELTSLVEQAAGRITILPGGTVREGNVRELVERAGVSQVHARATNPGVIEGIRAALG